MSRIGKIPVLIPDKVTVAVEGKIVKVKGPKGELEQKVPSSIGVKVEDNRVVFLILSDSKDSKAYWGLARSLVNNMVIGVTEGFKKVLEVRGREYKVNLQGKNLDFDLGYAHRIQISPKKGIEFELGSENKIIVKGIDKAIVGEQSAEIRDLRPPDVYKGKGIRYEGEYVAHKEGKKGL